MTHRMLAWLGFTLLGIALVQPAAAQKKAPEAALAQAEVLGGVVRLGVLTDETGVLSSASGEGSIEAARMAVEDFGSKAAGRPIEIVHADHQNKTDIGAAIARRWIDVDGVDAIVDVPNSAIALAVQELAKEKNRVLLVSTAATVDLTGKACSPVGVHWTWDTYAVAASAARAIVLQGGDSWFFLTADFAFGHAMQRDATRFIEASGGKVIGSVRHPLGTADFSSFLLQAQSSGPRSWARHCGQRYDQLNQAGGRVRPCPRRTAPCGNRHHHHRRPCRGARWRARPAVDDVVLLGPHRGKPAMVKALLRPARRHADADAGRCLFGRDALP